MTNSTTALARIWVHQLPKPFARRLAQALRDGPAALRSLQADTTLPASTAAVHEALRIADDGDGPYASGALTALLDSVGDLPTITPVWTGPESPRTADRLTLAVLADLISEAVSELLLVSYATLPGHQVRTALESADGRGVHITTLLERHEDNPKFDGHGDPLRGLNANRLYWPAAERPLGGSMHAKVLVVDRAVALVTSANLTGYGLERNLECGLLIRGGPVPAAIVDHITALPALRHLD